MSSVEKCYIPNCRNMANNKVLVSVSRDFSVRRIWWELVHGGKPLEPHSGLFCCEDHFDVPVDFENWHYFEIMGGTLRLKKGVLPHKYIDEPKGKPNESALTDSAMKRRLENIDRFQASLTKRVRFLEEDIPSTSKSVSRHLSTDKCTYPESQLQDTAAKSRRSLGLQVHLKASSQCDSDQGSEHIVSTEISTSADSEVQSARDNLMKGQIKDSTIHYIEKKIHILSRTAQLAIDFCVNTAEIRRTFM
nr:unnamed protein product [Callosobruchus analis]